MFTRLGEDRAASGVHTLDNQMVQDHLTLSTLHNVLLNAASCYKTIDVHLG